MRAKNVIQAMIGAFLVQSLLVCPELQAGCQETFLEKTQVTQKSVTEILTRAYLDGNAKFPQGNNGFELKMTLAVLLEGLSVLDIPTKPSTAYLNRVSKALDALHEKYGIEVKSSDLGPHRLEQAYLDAHGSLLQILLQARRYFEGGRNPMVSRFLDQQDLPFTTVEVTSRPENFEYAKERVDDFLTSEKFKKDKEELNDVARYLKAIIDSPLVSKELSRIQTLNFSQREEDGEKVDSPYIEEKIMAPIYMTFFHGLRRHFDYSDAEALVMSSILLNRRGPYKSQPILLDTMEKLPWLIKFSPYLRNKKESAESEGLSLREHQEKAPPISTKKSQTDLRIEQIYRALLEEFVLNKDGLGVILPSPRENVEVVRRSE